jgi:methionyl-tRNA formyltransferase
VHASLLPRWRGAAPIQAAILNGDDQTGVTIMRMNPGIDTGPILSQAAVRITPLETTVSLSEILSNIGADVLLKTLPQYLSGDLQPEPQDDSLATSAPMVHKSDGLLDFTQPAVILERKIRAFNPWPGTFTYWKGQAIKIHRVHISDGESLSPGKMLIEQNMPAISTAKGILVLDELQPAGKNILDGKTFLRGARDWGR